VPEEFSLGLTEVDVAVRRARLPANWHPFEIRSAGATLTEHERLSAEAWDALRSRRLASADKLDTDVEHTLRAWTHPEVLIMVRAVEAADGRHVFYRATIGNGLGVFSELAGEEILFARTRPDRLVDLVVGMLPDYGPVPLRELTITQEARPHPESARSDKQLLAREMGPLSSWPLHRCGTVELSARRRHGDLHSLGTVSFWDTEGGRLLVFVEQLADSGKRTRFVPSDGSHLRRWLHETTSESRR